MKYVKMQKGFSLLEISIVLIIVALLSSSVLVGQSLIQAAEMRNISQQYHQIKSAVISFQSKYQALPGDIDNGERFNLGESGVVEPSYQDGTVGNGDGNHRITESNSSTEFSDMTGEMATFWAHLTTPGKELLPSNYRGDGGSEVNSDVPALKINDNAGWAAYGTAKDRNFLYAGLANDTTNPTNTINILTPFQARELDEKVDDGMPNTGDVVARSADIVNLENTTSAGVQGAAATCINSDETPNIYQTQDETLECTLRFMLTAP